MTDVDYADDQELLVNSPTQDETLPNCQEQIARNISLFINSDKMEFMCFNPNDAISLLNGKPLK